MGQTVAKVAVSKAVYAIDKPYDYLVPPELEAELAAGMRVMVPFGSGNRCCEGLVLLFGQPKQCVRLKRIVAVLDERPVLDERGIQLALWMHERYFCTVYEAMRAMLPAGLYFSLKDCLVLREEDLTAEEANAKLAGHADAQRLFALLSSWGGKGDLEQIRLAFGTKKPDAAIHQLQKEGLATWDARAKRGVKDKMETIAVLAQPAEEALAQVLPSRAHFPVRCEVVQMLCSLGTVSVKELRYFTGASPATVRALERRGILRLEQQEVLRSAIPEPEEHTPPPTLNPEQETAFQGIDALCRGGRASVALLYGVTGSGKTQVYLRLIHEQLSRGRSAMVLVPEISLTPQLLKIFTAHFQRKVAILHSSLRSGERYDEWKRLHNGQARVVIGTRSAVFAPLRGIGLIVLDEEQESSYKSENSPRYHAREVAKYRCVQEKAVLLLGSATPSVESMYYAREGVYHLFTIQHRYNQKSLPRVIVADMKEELRGGNGTAVSSALARELEVNADRGEQSILFLNRRGASSMASCGVCGQVPECPHCSAHLVYHSANERLMCHYCGYSEPMPCACPHCGGSYLFLGYGTQRVQSELEERFPGQEVMRMDTDTVSARTPHEKMFARFQKERVPILLGTQMVAKGLDFENVTLVGVVAADLSLYVNDYRAGERSFSLITQVVGRAGRGDKQGRAVIQTFTPENDVIRFASKQDYDSFYAQEIDLRRRRGYPPFRDLLVITASSLNEEKTLRACTRLRESLEAWCVSLDQPTQLLGPAPASVVKVNNRYRYRITLLGKNTAGLRRLVSDLLRRAAADRSNKGVTMIADFDPFDL